MSMKSLVAGALLLGMASIAFANPTSTSPNIVNLSGQGGHTRANTILVLETTDTALDRALTALGQSYDQASGPPWPSPAGYADVFMGADGGLIEPADIQVLADYVNAGGRLHFYGGTCWQDFAIAMNQYLVQNDINNYCWTQVYTSPDFTIRDPNHCLANGLPSTYDWADQSASYYQFRSTDAGISVAANNGDGYAFLFSKNIGAGTFDYCIDSSYDYYYYSGDDFTHFKQIVSNMLNCGGPVPVQNSTWGQIKSIYH